MLGITHNPRLSSRSSTACCGLVKHVMHLSTHTHILTDTSCQGGFLDWAVLPVGLEDWQSRHARPIRSREREPPFFLPFTKKMRHKTKREQKERAVKCREEESRARGNTQEQVIRQQIILVLSLAHQPRSSDRSAHVLFYSSGFIKMHLFAFFLLILVDLKGKSALTKTSRVKVGMKRCYKCRHSNRKCYNTDSPVIPVAFRADLDVNGPVNTQTHILSHTHTH